MCANRHFHALWRHLGWGANTAKITVNVWDFGPLGTAITPLQRGGFPQRKSILKDIRIEIQVITTVNEFLRFHTNPSNQHYANYHEIRSHMRRFIIRIYERRTFFIASFSVEWMISIKLSWLKVVVNVGNPPLCSVVMAVSSGPKSHTFTVISVILTVFAPRARWR